MKQLYTLLLLIASLVSINAQTVLFCDTTSNVIVYSNYDGGILNLNIDQNIPNLKIGVVTYEAVQINISGPFAGNVTAVWYAGYNGNNDNCNLGVTNTTINGVPNPVDSILVYPPATVSDPNGSPNMVCGYSCTAGNQGGCNTAQQVAGFFMTKFGTTSIRFHRTNYNCFPSSTVNISSGGNCCLVPVITEVAENSMSSLFKVNPNPAKGSTIVSTPSYSTATTLEVMNVLGEVVRTVVIAAGTMQTTVSLEGLGSGVYMFRMQNDSEITTMPVVVSE
jgi:Secretion system C-terminal sorting domain